jgi:hypothetical protein
MGIEETADESAASLLQLPDPCLVAVLRCCADNPTSVCSAAKAHSRLHQAATTALSSIQLHMEASNYAYDPVPQHRLDNLVEVYLPSHGQLVDSINLQGCFNTGHPVHLRSCPPAKRHTRQATLQMHI